MSHFFSFVIITLSRKMKSGVNIKIGISNRVVAVLLKVQFFLVNSVLFVVYCY